jgi:acyl transferase domain-containing protein
VSEIKLPAGYAETDVAVVGMAARFPGANSVEAFWENVRNGVDAVSDLTDDELREVGVSEEELANPNYVRKCYAIDDMKGFDAGFFGFSPREAAIMDPQQRHFLELAWAALEDAGYDPDRLPGSAGVFAGCGASLYMMRNLLTNPELVDNVGFFLLRHTGNDKDFLATRVSYLMNLSGPSVNVQTACSTSLVAIHLGVQSLLSNECSVALAGGTTIRQPDRVGYEYVEGEIVSPDGRCRTFDAEASGTVFGSGVGVVVLKRLEDALADGDTVHAVIKGSAINNDGSAKVGYLAPSVEAQAANMAEALALAGVDPARVGHIECHGTATPVGDPIEVAALSQAFAGSGAAPGSIALGSVKTGIGHLDTAAGVAGFIKSVQAVKHGVLPASLHYEAPNPAIDFESGPFYVNTESRPWPSSDGHRYAAVTALGAGGTNAHIVIQSPPARPAAEPADREWEVVPVSARTPEALQATSEQMAEALVRDDVSFADAVHTLQMGRQSMKARRFAVASSGADAADLLTSGDARKAPTGEAPDVRRSVVFTFAGGGAQYPGMGRDLYESEAVYREAVEECARLIQPELDWDLKGLLYPPADQLEAAAREMERPSRSLPCLFTTQYAMARLLMSWGIEPEAMMGHSMGEYTAAHLAGVFSLRDALSLVAVRGRLFETLPAGGMLSVPLSADELEARLSPELSVAAENAPGMSVASGPVEALNRLEAELLAEDIECRRIHIEVAAHSSMLEPILQPFGVVTRKIQFSPPQRPFLSNVSGTWITPEQATDPDYWVRHLRQTVRFADGAGVVLEDEGRVFLEVGPGRILTTLVSLHSGKKPTHGFITTMRHPEEDTHDVAAALAAVGQLWIGGFEVDWSLLRGDEVRQRIPLPTYPFEHREYFIEPGEVGVPAPSLVRRNDPGRWLWRPTWNRASLPPEASDDAGSTWMFFLDPEGLGHALADRMEADGRRVIRVGRGPGYAMSGPDRFTVNPGEFSDFQKLVSAVSENGFPERIVHTWAATHGPVDEDRAFFSLLGLARALGEEAVDTDIRLDVLTAGGHFVGGDMRIEPDRSLVLGPVRVIAKEFDNVTCRGVDVPLPGTPGWFEGRVVEQMLRELAHEGDEEVVAWRGVERYVQGFEEVELPASDGLPAVRDGSTWLITGGTGGLGLLMARELAASARVRLALLSRSGQRPPEADELEALGAQVLVVRGDVTDEATMRAAAGEVRKAFGPIHGVIHAAGVIEDDLILMKDRDSAARVLSPKVTGTRVLDATTADDPLECVIYFSSRGAFAGVVGQVDYTAASAFMDAFAQQKAQIEGVNAFTINWSAWQDVGMAAGQTRSAGGRPASHPLLDRVLRDSAEQVEYQSTLAPASHWLLDGHRFRSGEALIPGTGYLEIMAAALEEKEGFRPFELRDVYFMAPFVVADDAKREMRVRGDFQDGSWDLVVEGRSGSGAWDEHSRGSASGLHEAPGRLDVETVRASCGARRVVFREDQQRNANLTLGHRWSNLRHIDYGASEALADLELPAEVSEETGSFALHPALLDVASACAQELVPGFSTDRMFFIPVSYGRVRVFDRLPARIVSHIRLQPGAGPDSDTAVYDITIATPEGRVVLEISDFTMFRVQEDAAGGTSVTTSPGAGEAEPALLQFEGAIKPEEGVDVFRRILASGIAGQWVVSPQHLEAYLHELRFPPEPEVQAAEPAHPAMDLVDASEVEAVLAGHEAIEEVVVLAHRQSDGSIRSTAFIVWELGEEITIAEVKRFLDGLVEESLIPEQIIEMEAFPRDANGEVLRHELPDPFAPKDSFVAPETETERVIAEIWKELLGVGRVSIDDNFLDVGGHSLLAMRAISRIAKATGVRLNPSVMTLNTLRQIAAEAEEKGRAAS